MSRWESQARLVALEKELLEKSSRVEVLQRQLEDSRRQADEWRSRQVEAEQKLRLCLQEREEGLVRQETAPPRVQVWQPTFSSIRFERF